MNGLRGSEAGASGRLLRRRELSSGGVTAAPSSGVPTVGRCPQGGHRDHSWGSWAHCKSSQHPGAELAAVERGQKESQKGTGLALHQGHRS